MKRLPLFVALVLVLGALAGCDSYEQDAYTPEYIVETYLVAGEPLPVLKLSTTAPIDARYTFEEYAVSNATVTVSLLDAQGGVAARYPYRPLSPGRYGPADAQAAVEPLRRYALEVTVPGADAVIRASTLVPGPFEVLDASADTIVYQSADQFEARVTPSAYPGRQSIYVFTIAARDTSYGLTPFYADFVDNEDANVEAEDFIENSSGIANEANFDENADGSLTLRLPWIALAFYGPNDIIANAVDDNVYDFLRSDGMGGGRSPGEMDNRLDHVEGGRGIFGSMARDSRPVFVRKP